MKLSTLNTSGIVTVGNYRTTTPTQASAFELLQLLPSTSYTISGWVMTNNVVTNGAWIEVREYSATLSNLITSFTSRLSGSNGWTKLTKTFTTQATTAFVVVFLRNNVAGNISDAWFDDIVLFPTTFTRSAAASRTLA